MFTLLLIYLDQNFISLTYGNVLHRLVQESRTANRVENRDSQRTVNIPLNGTISKGSLSIVSSLILLKNTNARKCRFFDQNHRLTPLENTHFLDFKTLTFLSS